MPVALWDTMLDDDTYRLLEEWYGNSLDLSTALGAMDKEGVVRLLDNIIEDSEYFGEKRGKERAKEAKRKLI